MNYNGTMIIGSILVVCGIQSIYYQITPSARFEIASSLQVWLNLNYISIFKCHQRGIHYVILR